MGTPDLLWGVCTTVKAPLPHILAFVAWHKHLGAARIWVHLDDADAVSGVVLNQIDGVTAILCDDAYWAQAGKRPKRQEPRQTYNMQRVYALAEVPFIAHLDVDEYIWAARPVSDVLAASPEDQPFVRMAPAEALHDPALKDDIFTARQFRLPFKPRTPSRIRRAVLGGYSAILPSNMMSHRVGKSLFRTGVHGLLPKIHAASFDGGAPISLPVTPDLVVLHFHAQDRAEWRAALPHRTKNGAYRFNKDLAAFFENVTPEQVDDFYDATQVASPQMVQSLADHGLLIEADLKLREKIAALEF